MVHYVRCREHGTFYGQCGCPDINGTKFVDCDRNRCDDRITPNERQHNALKERICRAWFSAPGFDPTALNYGACAESVLAMLKAEGLLVDGPYDWL